MQSDILGDILRSLVTTIPSVLVYSLGIIFALVQMRKAPKAAVIVVISLLMFLLLSIVQPVVFISISRAQGTPQWFQIVSMVFRLVYLAATGGLIFAVFCDRESPLANINPYAQQFGGVPPSGNPYAAPNPLPSLGDPMRPPQ